MVSQPRAGVISYFKYAEGEIIEAMGASADVSRVHR